MSETAEFWRGAFGTEYTARNDGTKLVNANEVFFRTMLDQEICDWPPNILEFGANRGANLQAFRNIDPHVALSAVEVNPEAAEHLRSLGYVNVFEQDMLNGAEDWGQYDLVLSKGLLIHIAPSDLFEAYDVLYRASKRNILIAEYFSPEPVEVPYRGHAGKLWKRDFAREMMARYPDLRCVHYEFFWRGDEDAPQDDITAFLLEKRS